MDYQEAIDWLYATQQFGIKLGLEQPRKLLSQFDGLPARETKVIHVAGTNGKGSTCALIDALSREYGLRTGLFTSPHLIDYTERIRIDGVEISKITTAELLTKIQEDCSDWEHHPTFFEITLAVAMRYFVRKECDVIILETGMGGRLDATTAVPADVAVITPIGLDHMQWLGNTIEKIAAEKAGIIVSGKPTLSSAQETAAAKIIKQHAQGKFSDLTFITEPYLSSRVNLAGSHQRQNAALAIAACREANIPLNKEQIESAFTKVKWPGRFDSIQVGDRTIIIDAAHNPHAAQSLVDTWQESYPDSRAPIVFGAVEGKNASKTLEILGKIKKHLHIVPVDSPRSLTTEEYLEAIPSGVSYTVHDSLEKAIAATKESKVTLVCGSIFLIGQAKAYLTNQPTRTTSQ